MSQNPTQGDATVSAPDLSSPTREGFLDILATLGSFDFAFVWALEDIEKCLVGADPARPDYFSSERIHTYTEEENNTAFNLYKILWQLRNELGVYEIPAWLQQDLHDLFSLEGFAHHDAPDTRAKAIFTLGCNAREWVLATLDLAEESLNLAAAIEDGRVEEGDIARLVTHLEARFEGIADA